MIIAYDHEKDELIQKKHGISFVEIEKSVRDGGVLAIVDHPNRDRYPHQKYLIVNIREYACVVPYVEKNDIFFLKTAFFSRKYTKKYLKGRSKSL